MGKQVKSGHQLQYVLLSLKFLGKLHFIYVMTSCLRVDLAGLYTDIILRIIDGPNNRELCWNTKLIFQAIRISSHRLT